VISKVLGYGIIAGAVAVKLPQIKKMCDSKNAEGMSKVSMHLELVGYLITAAYHLRTGNPFSTYGENFFITAQNLVILFLMYKYTNTAGRLVFVAIFYALVVFLLTGYAGPLTYDHVKYLQSGTTIIFSTARLSQIWACFKLGSAESLALATQFLLFAGSLARIFTTLQELSDQPTILLNFGVSAFLNGLLLAQIIYYNFIAGDKKKKE